MGLMSGAIRKHEADYGSEHSKDLREVMERVENYIVGPYIYNMQPPQEEEE